MLEGGRIFGHMLESHAMATAAQKRLIELEKINAPITDQVQQALLFAGIPLLDTSTRCASIESFEAAKPECQTKSHGRQEYVLRWLLKKLQDEETRQYTAPWRLLKRLTDFVPLRNLARALNERNFMMIIRQALEEVLEVMSLVDDSIDTAIGNPPLRRVGSSASRKRNRNGSILRPEPVFHLAMKDDKTIAEWKLAVYEAVNRIVQLAKPGPPSKEFSTSEYMRSAIRTSSGEAARILGAWLAICGTEDQPISIELDDSLLLPFLEVWDSRTVGFEDAKIFSIYCLKHSLEIMTLAGQKFHRIARLEKLLARNIIIPAKTAYGSSKDANFLSGLVGDVVSYNSSFAPIIFDVAIRCIQSHGSRPPTADDTVWLQAVIGALKGTMNGNLSEERVLALNQILRSCIDHKLSLELPLLRLITSQYGLPNGSTNWDILITIIKLDSNAFLIPSKQDDLLKDMLVRITEASAEVTWPTLADKVVDKVLVPLMGEFSKARQLTAFIHHWYEQLTNFDQIQQSPRKAVDHFSAWEDEAIQVRLNELLEPSLTTLQIVEIVDWLVERLKECQGAACVLLDAVAGAVSQGNTRTALHPILIKVINTLVYTGPDDRYKARLLHLNTVVLSWSLRQNFDDTSTEDGNSSLFRNLLSSEISFHDRDHSLVALEAFRYLCAHWSIGSPRFWANPSTAFQNGAGVEMFSNHMSSVASHIRNVVEQASEVRNLVEVKWEGRVVTIKRCVGWLACAYASCILVDYPQVLELCMEGQMLTDFIWLASTSSPSSSLHVEDPWLPLRHPGFPSMWMQMLHYDGYVENSKKISQNVINRMIECGTHVKNPIERSKACNGFVVMCFHHLPLELLTKSNREAILKAWTPEIFDPSLIDMATVIYKMAPLDPPVLSLKAKMFRLPTLYDGINFRELVDMAECIVASGREPKTLLEIFAQIPQLILDHVFATIDQPKSLNYIKGVKVALDTWLQENRKPSRMPSYAMIRLVQVVVTVWKTRGNSSDEFPMALKEATKELSGTFRDLLLLNLKWRLQDPEKLTDDDSERCMSLYSTMDALDVIGVGESDLLVLQVETMPTFDSLKGLNSELGKRFELFMAEHYPEVFGKPLKQLLGGDIVTVTDREAIRRKAFALTTGMTELEKLQLVHDLLEEAEEKEAADKLLALRYVIGTCEDFRTVIQEANDAQSASLSSSYSTLATKLRKSDSVRQCWLICEIMELILLEKPRTVTQHNIDITLASIAILCSRNSPNLNPSRSSKTYYHLVSLFNAILISHRRKLHGHFHIVIQTLQSLLHCLYVPSPNGAHNTMKGHSFPPWLIPSPGRCTLGAAHAAAYTRLLTLICDPSVSAVSRPSSSSSLNSATKKAKALAGQHMPFVLSAYIRAQLDMSLSMKQEIREALVPGWYAIFDTMTVEGRKALGEGMDASGRAILAGLIKDWLRFGKWNGA